jgi:hypothetical protein
MLGVMIKNPEVKDKEIQAVTPTDSLTFKIGAASAARSVNAKISALGACRPSLLMSEVLAASKSPTDKKMGDRESPVTG